MSTPDPYAAIGARPADVRGAGFDTAQRKGDVDVQSGQQGIVKSQADIENDRKRVALERDKFLLDLASKGLMLSPNGEIVPRPGGILGDPAKTAETVASESRVSGDLKTAVDAINLMTKGFNRNLAGRGLVRSTLEYFPSQEKSAINATSAGLADVGLALFKVPGAGTQSDSDARRFVEANQPSTWDSDFGYLGKIYNLRRRLDAKVASMGMGPIEWTEPTDVAARQFFALPETERAKIGAYTTDSAETSAAAPGAAPGAAAETPQPDRYPPEASALNQAMAVTTPLVAADSDADEVSRPIPAEMQREMQEWFAAHPRGALRPEDYANIRNALDEKYGFAPGIHNADDPNLRAFVDGYNGKSGLNTAIPPAVQPDTRNDVEKILGSAVMSPVGTAAATATAGTTANVMDMLFPEKMQALRELNPDAALAGDIFGSIGGASAIGKVGAATTKRLLGSSAPKLYNALMSSKRAAAAGRSALTDVAQGALYGGAVEGDAGTGAESGLTGNLVGLGLGKIGGGFLRGLTRSPEAEALFSRYGVGDMTIGQQMGGTAKAFEDAATSIPIVGDVINARRGESLINANEAAFREVAGGGLGYGESALDELARRRSDAYTQALENRSFDVNNPVFTQEMADALAARSSLTNEFKPQFDTAIENSLAGTSIGDTGIMTGDAYQQAMRKIAGYKPKRGTGFEQDFRDALSGVGATLRNQVEREAPEVIPALSAADTMYRGEKILEDAVNRARYDTLGLGGDVFRPGDLTAAVNTSGKRYPGEVPLADFAAAAQNVLPSKLPDSGTARRAALGAVALGGVGAGLGAGSSAGGGGEASDIVQGGAEGAVIPLATLAALALGGSKSGQRALTKTLFQRPQFAKTLGDLAAKYTPKLTPGLTPVITQYNKPSEDSGVRYDEKTNTIILPDGTRVDTDGNPVAKTPKKLPPAKNRAELIGRYAADRR